MEFAILPEASLVGGALDEDYEQPLSLLHHAVNQGCPAKGSKRYADDDVCIHFRPSVRIVANCSLLKLTPRRFASPMISFCACSASVVAYAVPESSGSAAATFSGSKAFLLKIFITRENSLKPSSISGRLLLKMNSDFEI